eukprot:756213-Hanusia_phi.AAC.1
MACADKQAATLATTMSDCDDEVMDSGGCRNGIRFRCVVEEGLMHAEDSLRKREVQTDPPTQWETGRDDAFAEAGGENAAVFEHLHSQSQEKGSPQGPSLGMRRSRPPSLTEFIPFIPGKIEERPCPGPSPMQTGREDQGSDEVNITDFKLLRQRSDPTAAAPPKPCRLNTVSYFARWKNESSGKMFSRVTGVLDGSNVILNGHRYDGLKDFLADVKNGFQLELPGSGGEISSQSDGEEQITEQEGPQVPQTPKRPTSYAAGEASRYRLLQMLQDSSTEMSQ